MIVAGTITAMKTALSKYLSFRERAVFLGLKG